MKSLDVISLLDREQMRADIEKESFREGDTVAVHVRIREGDKERIQIFKGVVIRRRKGAMDASFTVRKISGGIGVERIFPTHSPIIDRVERISEGRIRRSRLYYLRDLKGKAARIKTKRQTAK